jgi:hypothetical protein
MRTLTRSGLVWSLLLCLVLVNGFTTVPGVAHIAHHTAHKAGTHATGLCAWLCAAGQAVESDLVHLDVQNRSTVPVDWLTFDSFTALPTLRVWFRGPPLFSA